MVSTTQAVVLYVTTMQVIVFFIAIIFMTFSEGWRFIKINVSHKNQLHKFQRKYVRSK